ncbi:MAG: hypothetical protein NTW55_02615 [Planctomycetota bacterium]|nr:hypothetical protein [Planctomycetota bacterium]
MKERAYKTIKDLVFDVIRQTKGFADYQTVTKKVMERFPKSAWKESHWGYYRSHITSDIGRYRDEFPKKIRDNLRKGIVRLRKRQRKAPRIVLQEKKKEAKEDTIKQIGDEILRNVRFVIGVAAENNAQMRFKLNRWVYARLQQEEIRKKRPVKQSLWDSGIRVCQRCGRKFKSIKGVEVMQKCQIGTSRQFRI